MTTAPESVQRYPLQWPLGWKRTPADRRVAGNFTQTRHDSRTVDGITSRVSSLQPVSLAVAVHRLDRQLNEIGGEGPVLSSNLTLRLDGTPHSSSANPTDPGIACYFRFKGRATVLACDRYKRAADNVAAVAAHIDALRRIERYGVGTIEQALAGYKALPADTAADWRSVFGFGAHELVSPNMVQTAFKRLAQTAHPDRGGDDQTMAHLNRAREFALAELDPA